MGRLISLTALLFFIIALSAYPQAQENYILVTAESQMQLPANVITFSINLAEEDTTAQLALKKIKKQENNLVQLLKDFNIPDSNVAYSLKRFGRTPAHEKKPIMYRTIEEVALKLNNSDEYESFQQKLLSIGIYLFHSNFTSTEINKSKDACLAKALDNSKEKAEQICRKLKRKLGKVLEVESGNKYQVANPEESFYKTSYLQVAAMDQNLINIPQRVTLTATVRVKYQLK
jgi:uncharacterized protein YggE